MTFYFLTRENILTMVIRWIGCSLQEEVAAINLAKYRKVAEELESAEERADAAENSLQKARLQNRSMSVDTRVSSSRTVSDCFCLL